MKKKCILTKQVFSKNNQVFMKNSENWNPINFQWIPIVKLQEKFKV